MKISTVRAGVVLRILVLVTSMFIGTLKTVSGQSWVGQRTFISNGQSTPRINGLITGTFTKRVGGFVWFQTQKTYSETYGGITYSPKPWLQFALGSGIEQDKNPARVGGYVWIGNAKNSMLFVPEYGGSGFWWKLESNRKVNKSIGLGVLVERFKGAGPRVEFYIPKTRLVVWVAPMFEKQRVNALIGIRWNL